MRKKVLFFMFSLVGGGAQRTIVNIINNIDKEKFEITLVLGDGAKNDYKDILDDAIKVINLRKKRIRYCLFALRRVIISENPDVLFTTINSNNILLILSRIITFRSIPTIVRESNNRTESGNVRLLNKCVTRVLYNHFSDKIIALSEGVKIDLVENFNINIHKIKVIYNPIDLEMINKMKNEPIENDSHIDRSMKTIIAVGRLVEQKDYLTLIKAFELVLKRIDATLLILGVGPERENIESLAKEKRIHHKIVFLGFQSNPYKYMKNSDVFVLTSRWEGFGHVIVEAMASGVPVVSTDCNSGPAEIIKNNLNGKLVRTGDHFDIAAKIIEIFESDSDNLIAGGEKRALDFDAKTILRQYEEVFLNERDQADLKTNKQAI